MSRKNIARKDFSQNFLHDRRLIRDLVSKAQIAPDDLVIEIGPGEGAITGELLGRARQVLAVEVDVALARRLGRRFGKDAGFTLFAGDFLAFPLPWTPYKVFANPPYRHTAAIVSKLTTGVAPPTDIFLAMQDEAAQRYLGQPQGTMVAAHLAPWFEVKVVHRFARTDFRPMPAVESVMVRIQQRATPLLDPKHSSRYRDLVAAVFTAWQPTIEDALAEVLERRTSAQVRSGKGRTCRSRPSSLPPAEWIGLYELVQEVATGADWERIHSVAERLEAQQARLVRPTRTPSGRARGQPR